MDSPVWPGAEAEVMDFTTRHSSPLWASVVLLWVVGPATSYSFKALSLVSSIIELRLLRARLPGSLFHMMVDPTERLSSRNRPAVAHVSAAL